MDPEPEDVTLNFLGLTERAEHGHGRKPSQGGIHETEKV